jgi:hypothetical protein
VVGVHVGDDDAAHRPAFERPGQGLLPGRDQRRRGDAGVHHRPAVAVPQRPDVDVVEKERQAQAHAEDPRRDPAGLAGLKLRLVGEGIGQVRAEFLCRFRRERTVHRARLHSKPSMRPNGARVKAVRCVELDEKA